MRRSATPDDMTEEDVRGGVWWAEAAFACTFGFFDGDGEGEAMAASRVGGGIRRHRTNANVFFKNVEKLRVDYGRMMMMMTLDEIFFSEQQWGIFGPVTFLQVWMQAHTHRNLSPLAQLALAGI